MLTGFAINEFLIAFWGRFEADHRGPLGGADGKGSVYAARSANIIYSYWVFAKFCIENM